MLLFINKYGGRLKAYTVIELLIVILIMALLFAVAANNFYNIRQQRRDIVRIGDINNISNALEQYKLVEGNYPLMLTPGQPLIGEKSGLVFMDLVPESREYKRVNCLYSDYYYEYKPEDDSYIMHFCFESNLEGYNPGSKCFVDGSIVEGFCGFVCGDVFVDNRDGQYYDTVQIGDQCWMAENLNYDNTCTTNAFVNNTDTGWCGCYNNDSANCDIYGKLYQWSAAMDFAEVGDIEVENHKGVCPPGWYIPSHFDLTDLELSVCTSGSCVSDFPYNYNTYNWRGANEAVALKSVDPAWSGGLANNSSGFNLKASGAMDYFGSFIYIGSRAILWSSNSYSSTLAWRRYFNSSYSTINRYMREKASGFSVRCLKKD